MWTASDIRQTFLDYFRDNGHDVIASSPLVPHHDPTLLFTNAGMVPFKNYFTGLETPAFSRAVSSQKCVRAGGKHNDLENVGYTARHHTFFEMLGNFSFGNYFKEEAINFAWDFVHRVLNLPKDRLLITVFHTDDEAARLWTKIAGLRENQLIRIKGADNFWSMGETGPCGPCSEIFYDHGPSVPGGPPGSPNEDGDRFVEIWNLVFMQYNQQSGQNGQPGLRLDLPKPSIDTGSGLERLAAVLQGVHNTYDTDIFQHLIKTSESVVGDQATGKALFSHRVIADHLRASGFLIADGVMPSNEGRGYVLRRIMRRAMRHAYLLGCKEPLMHKLVPALVGQMGTAFPDLHRAEPLMIQTLKAEENRFRATLGKGLKLLSEASEKINNRGELPGNIAFKLYDTYGFPLDLTQDILRAEGKTVDESGFTSAMARQKEDARANWSGSGDKTSEAIWFDLSQKISPSEFLGYTATKGEGIVEALVANEKSVSEITAGQSFFLVCNQTPFYAESGGQVGDTGTAISLSPQGDEARLTILGTTKKGNNLFVHEALLEEGCLKTGTVLSLCVDKKRRDRVAANHSATHLLHKVLRTYLGDQVVQKGSLVTPDRLRFDFSHEGPLTPDQLIHIDSEVNRCIRENTQTQTRIMSPQEALETGAMALFGEKYGEEVRVVFMGDTTLDSSHASVELCGGTHVERTGNIGTFKLVSETGVAAGIRRLEALTGQDAEKYSRTQEALVKNLSRRLKTTPEGLPEKVNQLLEDRKHFEGEIKILRQKIAGGGSSNSHGPESVAGIPFIGRTLEGVPGKDLKALSDQLRQTYPNSVIALVSEDGGKASLVVSLNKDLASKMNAVEIVRAGSAAVGGKGGGGRPDMAQAGGPDGTKVHKALEAIKAFITEIA